MELPDWARTGLGITALCSFVAWWGRQQAHRIDRLSESKADHSAIRSMLEDFQRANEAARTDFGLLHRKIDAQTASIADVRDRVSRIEGRLGR